MPVVAGSTVKLKATWNVPAGADPAAIERHYFDVHVPLVRRIPGLALHVVIRFLSDARGSHPAWWRGEELWFPDRATFEAAMASPEWEAALGDGLTSLVCGPRFDVFAIEEEFTPEGAEGAGPVEGAAQTVALTGVWQVPTFLTPADVDPVYLDAHVPGVRRLPRLRRHTVMKAVEWPPGEHPRYWRSAEIRLGSREDFDAAFSSPGYQAIRTDGFRESICGPDVDIFVVEEEWAGPTA